jgi:hypothetical protein
MRPPRVAVRVAHAEILQLAAKREDGPAVEVKQAVMDGNSGETRGLKHGGREGWM